MGLSCKYDRDIAEVAEKIRPLGQKWMDELAYAYLSLNDKSYLPTIAQKIIADAKDEELHGPKVATRGLHDGWRWQVWSDGRFEGETAEGFEPFKNLDDFKRFVYVAGLKRT